ncbi:hypothetical protein [Gleimia europaea]|uniref:Uncharacterized protein n=1 Tax=Gleimia europaea ACS-120-V-Col10b TaxID=883069 RepID=A0A9W5VX80_9ACTO|nr:hypothetical protein [Gleimia europaea]EPD31654.1 hypothetical protein HMPREF9238_01432 [Gleimia europaea ACS-120-V-Col10b]
MKDESSDLMGEGLPASPAVCARSARVRRRRRAERVSRADLQIIEDGGSPSWEQIRPLEPPEWNGKPSDPVVESARDREFRENKPPHW